jgi:hypothetical protein
MVEKSGEPIEVSCHVENTGGFGVDAQLSPREDLEQALERADPAWQCDESI